MNIASIRRDYQLRSLSENDVASHPLKQFSIWWDEAIASEIDEVNAMTLSTVRADGSPSSRIVLLKGYDENGFVFYTNYESNKGQQINHNPSVALLFFWKELERQVRIQGTCQRITAEESDAYFHSRPIGSQLGAWASPQSQRIAGRELLESRAAELKIQYQDIAIPRPPHWGGFRIVPSEVEFWQGRSNRLHDRILYSNDAADAWKIERLAP
jgi:pyridoxamine 5'-phosphate oxidase